MSLHHIAKNLENRGRGKDSVLVHMTPREVGGLQALAKAQGGSLTRNPETGLYEAGFLEQVLPIVAMAAATYFTAGAAAPMLMSAGMGATSAGILAGAGAGALISGGSAAIQGQDVGKAALTGAAVGGIGGGLGSLGGGETAVTGGAENAGAGLNPNAPAPGGGISPGPAPTPGNPNIPLQQSTQVGTNALNLNPNTGAPIDPLMGSGTPGAPGPGAPSGPLPKVPVGGYSGLTGPQAVPGPNVPTSSLTPTANAINSALPGQSVMPGVQPPATPTGSGIDSTLNAGKSAEQLAGDRLLKQQADAVAAAKADPNSSWWAKQTPFEKAGYTTAGAGILAAMNPRQTMPVEDTSDDGNYLKRISPNFRAQEPIRPNPYYRAQYPTYAAEGGIMRLAMGGQPSGPVEQMTQNMMGGQGNMYPQSQQEHTNFATPTQMPASAEVIKSDYDSKTDPYTGVMMADGGIATLGSYSDGGRLLKGPGDGVSDNIPATIGGHQPARLADGEFVVPARIVSELGNGSTDAGAKRLYAMMDRIQSKRKKSIGKGKFAVNSKADKDLPV